MSDETATGEGAAEERISVPRLARWNELPLTEDRLARRRLGAAGRAVIDELVATNAPTERLIELAERTEALAAELAGYGHRGAYSGFSEAANAGSAVERLRRAVDSGDPEAFASFDDSPFIGLSNPMSPPVTLEYHDDVIRGEVTLGAAYEGPPGCVHGGYVAGVFDELLGATQSLSGTQGMTANLRVDYRAPTPLHSRLELEGRLLGIDGRKITTYGTIHHEGTLTAEAHGLFISMDPELFRALLSARESRSDG